MPHPEPYSGEADLEKFEVFVAALLWWLLLNLLLGSDCMSTLTQVRYLGNCLKGNAQEWYVRNVKHHDRVVREWTLESALIEMQKHFLHSLTHRYASTTYETTHQGSGTAQDLLNRLNKLTMHMVRKLDNYTQRKRFLVALCDLLRREVLTRGHTTEFSCMVDLVSTTSQVEDAMQYDMGARQSEVQHRAAVPPQPIPARVWAQPPHPVPPGNRNRETTGRKPAATTPARLAPPKPTNPVGSKSAHNAGNKQTTPVCYQCGQPGHISSNCPQRQGKPCAAAARMADEGEEDDPPEDDPEEEVPLEVPQEEGDKQGESPLEDLDYPDDAIEGFRSKQPHHQWDELNDEETPLFRANALRTLNGGPRVLQ